MLEHSEVAVIRYLIEECGVNVHTMDDYALRWASYMGHLNVVQYLVEQGANVHASDDLALRWASGNGHMEIVQYLVERGANIHAQNAE